MDTESASSDTVTFPPPPRNVIVADSMLQQILLARAVLLLVWLGMIIEWMNFLLAGKAITPAVVLRALAENGGFDFIAIAFMIGIIWGLRVLRDFYEAYARKAREWPIANARVLSFTRNPGRDSPMIAKLEYEAGGRVMAADLSVTGTVDTTIPFFILYEPGGADRPISVKSIPTCIQFPDGTPFSSLAQQS